MTDEKFLSKAYDLGAPEKAAAFYNDWASTYDAEVGDNGYLTPGRCVEALTSLDPSLAAPVIDLGCGTGLAGLALRAAGFEPVDGVDFSEGMLARARELGCYRDLWRADLNLPLFDQIPEPETPYAHAMAAGVLNPGHAPASAILGVMEILPSGGYFVFSLNDHALEERSYEARINDVVDGGWARIAFKEYGDHLPGTGLQAMVYALERC